MVHKTIEDVSRVACLVATLQEAAHTYETSKSTYNCQRLATAGAELSEFMRKIKLRKADK